MHTALRQRDGTTPHSTALGCATLPWDVLYCIGLRCHALRASVIDLYCSELMLAVKLALVLAQDSNGGEVSKESEMVATRTCCPQAC